MENETRSPQETPAVGLDKPTFKHWFSNHPHLPLWIAVGRANPDQWEIVKCAMAVAYNGGMEDMERHHYASVLPLVESSAQALETVHTKDDALNPKDSV